MTIDIEITNGHLDSIAVYINSLLKPKTEQFSIDELNKNPQAVEEFNQHFNNINLSTKQLDTHAVNLIHLLDPSRQIDSIWKLDETILNDTKQDWISGTLAGIAAQNDSNHQEVDVETTESAPLEILPANATLSQKSDTSFQEPVDDNDKGWLHSKINKFFEDATRQGLEALGFPDPDKNSTIQASEQIETLDSTVESITEVPADNTRTDYVTRQADDKPQEELGIETDKANKAGDTTAAKPIKEAQSQVADVNTNGTTTPEKVCDDKIVHFDMNEAVTNIQIALNTHLEQNIAEDGMFGKGTSDELDRVLAEAGLNDVSRDPNEYSSMIEKLQGMDEYKELGDALEVMQSHNERVPGEPDASALARVYNNYESDIDCSLDTRNPGTWTITAPPLVRPFNAGGLNQQAADNIAPAQVENDISPITPVVP